jgi:hypothetical protein
MLPGGSAPQIAPLVLIPGNQHHAGMPSPDKGERAFVVPRAVTRIHAAIRADDRRLDPRKQSRPERNGSTSYGQTRLPGSAVDVRPRWVGWRLAAPTFTCSAHSGA